jgi:RNA polymerase sigma-70 factor, ECF subfamily
MNLAAGQLVNWTSSENVEIARGLRHRDPDLLDRLIEQYQHRLLRYLLYLTGNRELAEDLFQETWMRVLERGAQYNGKAKFDTWLFAIARHLVIDNSRKKTTSSLETLQQNHEGERPFEPAAADPTPFETLASSERGAHVTAALAKLDRMHREVIVLRFHEELTLEEIAGITGAPLSTVKSRLYRGLAALKPGFMGARA